MPQVKHLLYINYGISRSKKGFDELFPVQNPCCKTDSRKILFFREPLRREFSSLSESFVAKVALEWLDIFMDRPKVDFQFYFFSKAFFTHGALERFQLFVHDFNVTLQTVL